MLFGSRCLLILRDQLPKNFSPRGQRQFLAHLCLLSDSQQGAAFSKETGDAPCCLTKIFRAEHLRVFFSLLNKTHKVTLPSAPLRQETNKGPQGLAEVPRQIFLRQCVMKTFCLI